MQYINPTDMTKEEFLQKKGEPISELVAKEMTLAAGEKVMIVLVQNPQFSAAGIMENEQDVVKVFESPHDTRPKSFWLMNRELAYSEVRPLV